jgi:hypothetical protein
MTPYGAKNKSKGAARTAAEIEKAAREREFQPSDIFAEVLSDYPRVLTYVFAIRFKADLTHQRRVELPVEGVVALSFGI